MLSCGIFHSHCVDTTGVVMASGVSLGMGQQRSKFTKVMDIPPIIQLAAPKVGFHSFFLDCNGEVWVIGDNEKGQLGAENHKKVTTIITIGNLPSISMVSCGHYHTILLDYSGAVWGTGSNEHGQLSLENKAVEKLTSFTLLPTSHIGNIVKVCCGEEFTLIGTPSGDLWGCGDNEFGQLGCVDKIMNTFRMIQVQTNDFAHNFFCGYSHTLILGERGGVWSVGLNQQGQLGLGDKVNRDQFTQITNIPPIQNIFCGAYYTVLIDEHGAGWGCGWNEHGQLGVGNPVNTFSPQLIPGIPKINGGDGGWYQTFLRDVEGGLWGCGRNKEGQLGLGEQQFAFHCVKIDEIVVGEDLKKEKRFKTTKRAL